MNGQMDRQIDEWTVGLMNGQMDEWMMDEWMV